MAIGAVVLIGSKLPNGLIITHPLKRDFKAEIRGLNSMPAGRNGKKLIVPYVTTEIDKDLWDAWYTVHGSPAKTYPALSNGAIFIARTEEAAKKIAGERVKEKTGLESMDQVGDYRLGADAKKLTVATTED